MQDIVPLRTRSRIVKTEETLQYDRNVKSNFIILSKIDQIKNEESDLINRLDF